MAFPELAHTSSLKDKRWDSHKALQQLVARRWKNKYVIELQRRNRWIIEKDNLKQNDFVLVKEDLLPATE